MHVHPMPPEVRCDVLVVGAGPAGAMAARESARRGASVMLVDKARFPRFKVCGCCIGPAAEGELRAAGLEGLLEGVGGLRLREVVLAAGGRSVGLPWTGTSLSRTAFDAALVRAAIAAGARFFDHTVASHGALGMRARRVILRHAGGACVASARVVLVCDGLGGRFLDGDEATSLRIARDARLGVCTIVGAESEDAPPPGRIVMACGGGGYVGLVRLEDGSLNIAAALDLAVLRRSPSPGHAVAAILKAAGVAAPADAIIAAPWHGTPRLTRTRPRLGDQRLLVVGDAAGYVEPFTGEGIGWALASGRAGGRLAAEAAGSPGAAADLVDRWTAEHRLLLRARQRECRWITLALRSGRLTAAAVRVLGLAPALATPLMRRIHRPLTVEPRLATA